MKDKLRELTERWSNRDYDETDHLQGYADGIRQASNELLAILDADGDGGAVGWQDKVNEIANNIGESLNAGCDQDAVDRINVYVDELFALATHPARSGVVSDAKCRDFLCKMPLSAAHTPIEMVRVALEYYERTRK